MEIIAQFYASIKDGGHIGLTNEIKFYIWYMYDILFSNILRKVSGTIYDFLSENVHVLGPR